MNKFIALLNHWLGVESVRKEISATRQRAEELSRSVVKASERVDLRLEQLAKMRERFNKELGRMEADLESAKMINNKLNAELAVVNEMLEAKDKLIIPGLVSACEMLHSRFEADVAVQALRKMGATPNGGE